MLKNLVVIAVLMVLVQACVKKQIPQGEELLGLEYYPAKTGSFIVYQADSVVYTELPRDTLYYKYQVKEKIADQFTDNEGKTAIRLERYIKKFDPLKSYDSIPWSVKEVFMITLSNKSVQIQENNVRYTKLIFPVQEKATWNGNAQNTMGAADYQYDYIDRNEKINSKVFENTLRVKQVEKVTLISEKKQSEKYAKGVGLVFKEYIELYSNNVVPGKSVEERIESGVYFTQSYLFSGNE